MLRNLIRQWLGINDQQAFLRKINNDLDDIDQQLRNICTDLNIHNRALGRIIAKLDPMYGLPEDSLARRADSDHLANEVLAKLRGEYQASKVP